MKFEEYWKNGKYYKNGRGEKVRIYALDGGGVTPIHGANLSPHNGWEYDYFHSNGKHRYTDYNIVGEWEEEKKEDWVEGYKAWREYNQLPPEEDLIPPENYFKKLGINNDMFDKNMVFNITFEKRECDCGAEIAKDTHANWCITKERI